MATKDELAKAAERLRNVRAANEISHEAYSKAIDEAYGFGENYGALLADESDAIDDWLAERDPTPLTVEVLVEMGFTVREYTASFGDDSLMLLKTVSGSWWFSGHGKRTISTVGELRTLARLAGVELTKGGK